MSKLTVVAVLKLLMLLDSDMIELKLIFHIPFSKWHLAFVELVFMLGYMMK